MFLAWLIGEFWICDEKSIDKPPFAYYNNVAVGATPNASASINAVVAPSRMSLSRHSPK